MTFIDITIVVISLISVLVGLFRGFTLELLSLMSWIVGFWSAFYFMDYVDIMYRPYIEIAFFRGVLSFFSVLIPMLILCGITSKLLGNAIRRSAFGGVDRTAGAVFGFLRSSVLVLLSLFFMRIFFSNATWWEESITIPVFMKVMDSIEIFFPKLFDRDAFI